MDKHKQKMLQDYWKKKAQTENKSCQTLSKVVTSINIQCDLEDDDIVMNTKPKMYIYNLKD